MAALSTSYTVETLPKTMLLVESISDSATSLKVNYVPVIMTKGILILDEGQDNEELVGFGTVTDNGDDTATIGDLTRGLPFTADNFTGSSTRAYEHTGNACTVRLVVSHQLLNRTAKTDQANSFSEHQTIATAKELRFKDSNQAIYESGNELYFKSSTTAAKSLATLAAAAGSDEKLKVSIDDTTSGYLSAKLTGGDGIAVAEVNGGGNETYDIDVDLATDPGLEFSSGQLRVKAHTGLTRDSNGISVNQSALTAIPKTVSVVYCSGAASAALSNPTSATDFDTHTYTIPANDLVNGVMYEVEGYVEWTPAGTYDFTTTLRLGNSSLAAVTFTSTAGSTRANAFRARIFGTAAAGASVNVRTELWGHATGGVSDAISEYGANTTALATNGTLAIEVAGHFGTSNAANTATLYSVVIRKYSSSAFT